MKIIHINFSRINLILCTLFSLFVSNVAWAVDYYWVGNTGLWSDAANHWATTSGGTIFHATPPTINDNVFFDVNSFTAPDHVVGVDVLAFCNNMDWTGVTNAPVLQDWAFAELTIGGSVTMTSQVILEYLADIVLSAITPGHTIFWQPTYGDDFDFNRLVFNGPGGEWSLVGDINIPEIRLDAGTLNTKNQTVTVGVFTFFNTGVKTLNLSGSTINVRKWNRFNLSGFTVNAGTSSIYVSQQFVGGGLIYNDVIFNAPGSIITLSGSNTFNTLTLTPGTSLLVERFTTQTFNNLDMNGTPTQGISIAGEFDKQVTFAKATTGDVTINYAVLSDNMAQGTGTFTALNSTDAGNNTGWNIPLVTPVFQSEEAAITRDSQYSLKLEWKKGSGAQHLVLAKESTPVDAVPLDDVAYTSNSTFGLGSEIGTGNFVVYAGTGEAVDVVGLNPDTEYHFAVFDFNTLTPNIKYNVTNAATASWFTLPSNYYTMDGVPSVQVCNGRIFDSGGHFDYLSYENGVKTISPSVAGTKVRLSFIKFDVTPCCGDALNIYDGPNTSSPLLGTYTGVTNPGTISATGAGGELTLSFTSVNSTVAAGWEADIYCYTDGSAPDISSSSLTFNKVLDVSLDLSWVSGSGEERIVVARQGAAVDQIPIDNTTYTANSVFGAGQDLGGGNFVVYQGHGNSFPLSGLAASVTYHFAIYEFNISGGNTLYRTLNPGIGITTTTTAPILVSDTPISTCFDNYSDSGGANNDYSFNENFTQTITPSLAGKAIQINFSEFDIEDGFDFLSIYDGPDMTSTLVGTFSGTNSPGSVTATNPDGVLTVVFTSDEVVVRPGWAATINCIDMMTKLPQTITFPVIADKTYGVANFALAATATSGLAVSYSVISGPATINGSTVTITGVGGVTLEVTQTGDATNEAAIPVQQSFTVNKASLTATADDKTITYGDALPALTISYSGFASGQDANVLTAEPTISTVATASSDAGTHAISLAGGSAINYTITLIAGSLTINKANATITVADLEQIFDGTEKEATITTNPSGLDYSATYNGSEVPPIALGSYDLIVTISNVNYEGQSSATFLIQLILGSEDNLAKDKITIYPVPSDQEILFKGDLNNLKRVQIYNRNGQIMLDEVFVKQQRLDISQIPVGSYILSLVDRNGTRKLTQPILIK